MTLAERTRSRQRPAGRQAGRRPGRRRRPVDVRLIGNFGRVEKLDARATAPTCGRPSRATTRCGPTWPTARSPTKPRSSPGWRSGRAGRSLLLRRDRRRRARAVGIATLMEIRPAMRVIEVGHIVYSPALQRTPLATEAQYLLARYVFETLGYRRYEWKCNALNAPSRRAAERFGFTFEGIFRQHLIVKGRNRDTAWFSMLDSEWPARKAAFERWLGAGEFRRGRPAEEEPRRLDEVMSVLTGLRRATAADVDALTALQHAAYARNRDILGVEPLPLLADYADVVVALRSLARRRRRTASKAPSS